MGRYRVETIGDGGYPLDSADTYRDMGARGLTDRAERELADSYARTMVAKYDGFPYRIVIRNCEGVIVEDLYDRQTLARYDCLQAGTHDARDIRVPCDRCRI